MYEYLIGLEYEPEEFSGQIEIVERKVFWTRCSELIRSSNGQLEHGSERFQSNLNIKYRISLSAVTQGYSWLYFPVEYSPVYFFVLNEK